MKIFTVRDLDRKPSAVLDVADTDGAVRIKRQASKITALPDFALRRKAIFPKTIPATQVRGVDKRIAGELLPCADIQPKSSGRFLTKTHPDQEKRRVAAGLG